MTPQQIETTTIAAGAGTTILAHVAAYAVLVTPVLHAFALLVTAVVGVLTGIWTWKKIRGH